MTFLDRYKLNFKMNIEERKVTKSYLELAASLFQECSIMGIYLKIKQND